MPLFKSLSPPRAEIQIELGKEEFALGETLEGSVLLKCLEDFEVQSVSVDLVGKEMVKGNLLDYSGDDQTRIYSPVTSLARTARPAEINLLMHSNPAPVSGPFKASKDYSGRFTFRFFIPSHLGPTYQGGRQDGSWLQRTWFVKVNVAVAGRPDLEAAKEIRVSIPAPKMQAAAGSAAFSPGSSAAPSDVQGAAAKAGPSEEQVPTNCPRCGAPFAVSQEDIFVTCRYCGYSMTIASRQRLGKHSMIETRLFRQQVAEAAKRYMDKGIFRIGVAKEAVITNIVLRYLPFWIFRANTTTSFRGTVGGGLGAPVGGSEAQAAEVLGRIIIAGADAYMRSRGGPGARIGYSQSAPRPVAQTFSNSYVWPVLARSSLISEVNFYEIPAEKKIPFDQGKLPAEAEFLKPEMSEEEAKLKARAEIEAKERQIASRKVSVLETISTTLYLSEGELIHAPVWFVYYTIKGDNYVIAIDGCEGRPLGGGRPAFKISL
uniref:Arrestin-like N-terminal domain-containing protein n=1 Tax=Candidatus Methanosuratincola petrocarbonis (ex Vanwonterghem et al. 2016) TaxID=1867261 RepID=A0A7J3V0R1_9CREN